MRKLFSFLIALVVTVGGAASAFGGSMMLLGVGKAPGAAPAGYQGLGDVVGSFTFFRSCARPYSAAVAASGAAACDVVDTATGTISCTYHLQTTGFVNPSECSGAGQACQTACRVKKRYNQVNPGTYDDTNATLANMPDLAFAQINGLPAAQVTAANSQVLTANASITRTGATSFGTVGKRTVSVAGGFLSAVSQIFEVRGSFSANTLAFSCGASNTTLTPADNSWHGLGFVCPAVSGSSVQNVDGTQTGGITNGVGNLTSAVFRVGESQGNVFQTGYVAEDWLYPGDATSLLGTIYSNQHGTNGYNGTF